MSEFSELKAEILRRAKATEACVDEYKKAAKAETAPELLRVVLTNIHWCVREKVVDVELLSKFPESELTEAGIFLTASNRT